MTNANLTPFIGSDELDNYFLCIRLEVVLQELLSNKQTI